jgi:hypothetical protein
MFLDVEFTIDLCLGLVLHFILVFMTLTLYVYLSSTVQYDMPQVCTIITEKNDHERPFTFCVSSTFFESLDEDDDSVVDSLSPDP